MVLIWTMKNLRKFFVLLSGLLRLLSKSSLVFSWLPVLERLFSDSMRRVVTADKVSVGFQFLNEDGKELGNVRYNLIEGYFVIFTWPPMFSSLRKAQELLRLLSFAIRIIRAEKVTF